MPAQLIEVLGKNESAWKGISDYGSLLLLKDTQKSADDIIRLLGAKGDDFLRVYRTYGDTAADAMLRCGGDAIKDIDAYGSEFLRLIDTYGDDFVNLYRQYDTLAVKRCVSRADEIFALVVKYGDDCIDPIMRYGDEVIDGIAKHGDDFMNRYLAEGDGFVEEFLEKGDEVFSNSSEVVIIVKETDLFIDYMNSAGTTIHIAKQSTQSIDSAIESKLKSAVAGDVIEAKVANYIKNDLGVELTHFSSNVKTPQGQILGDIDCATDNVLIEVKKSIASVHDGQFEKYVIKESSNYINVTNKKVVLYIDEEMINISTINQEKLDIIREMGVKVVNSLEELKEVLE